ncbi:ribonuclease domain-containing protein [Streptococcus ovis]|uniref:ribonuclease domain-containing protein n=1 Tax=Streptococcus ovis TaxID=82806 RepID=UPI000367FB34|nr:ribonuclease domain-containing protein [Streptococcus ovis]
MIKNLDIQSVKGTLTRTPEEIKASNQRVWDNFVTSLKHLAGETFAVYDLIRLFRGKDPVTGKSSNRWVAGASVLLELVPYVGQVANMARMAKVAKVSNKVDDLPKAARVVAKVDDVGDIKKGLQGSKHLTELPQEVQDAYRGYDSVGWKGNYKGQTSGTSAGRTFRNREGSLPKTDMRGNNITYKEYDVNSKIVGDSRDKQRLIRGSDGSVYYTGDHYGTFIKVK